MGKRGWMAVSAVALAGMIAIVGVSAFMGGCSKMVETAAGGTVPMKCHWTFVATAFAGMAGVLTALLALASSTKEGRRNAAAATLATAVVAVLLTTPAGIGLCSGADMHCHQTATALWVAAGIAIVLTLVQIAKADPRGAEQPKMKL